MENSLYVIKWKSVSIRPGRDIAEENKTKRENKFAPSDQIDGNMSLQLVFHQSSL